jgi:hypothetical protein
LSGVTRLLFAPAALSAVEDYIFAFNLLKTIFGFVLGFWWIYSPILLFIGVYNIFELYNRTKYLLSQEWVLLEIKIPKDLHKSPKAAEQIFATLHGIYLPVKWYFRFFQGKVPDWFSLELAGVNGDVHFYIRTLKQYKSFVESQIYAQYPEAEIVESEDYLNTLPWPIPNDQYDLWGAEFILNKEDAYPIRTYPEFEEKSTSPDDVKRIDPLASVIESISTLTPGEVLGIQILIRPTGDAWVKKGMELVDKLMGKTSPASSEKNIIGDIIHGIDSFIFGPTEAVEQKRPEEKRKDLSPGTQEVLKAMEKSFLKLGYETGIRFIYAAPKDRFLPSNISAVSGFFKQYSTSTLNGFKINANAMTVGRGLFKKNDTYIKKVRIYRRFRERSFLNLNKYFVLNVEELATIYHFPDRGVKAPFLPRIEAKKGEPPVGLPTA